MFVEPVDSETSSLNSSVKQVHSDPPLEEVVEANEVEHQPGVESVDEESPNPITRSYIEVDAADEKVTEDAVSGPTLDEETSVVSVSEKEDEATTPVDEVLDSPTINSTVVVEGDSELVEAVEVKGDSEVAEAVEAPVTEGDSAVPEPPAEPAGPPFEEHMAKATEAKNTATDAFKKGDFHTAKLHYMTALETLQVSPLRGRKHALFIDD